ncbi:MAG: flagellar biosynthesis protein FlgA [Magnetospirillum sp.]|nr:flagellar biosynthesis protein FlgA [Magnetospirillum sp.]
MPIAALARRAAEGKPVRVGLIGAGRFGTQFLAQARTLSGLHVVAVADRNLERAHTALALAAWPPVKAVARSLRAALDSGGTWITDQPLALMQTPGLEVVIEATGDARGAFGHARTASAAGFSVVLAAAVADALAGPLLAAEADAAGVVYSLACGDHPALVIELVEWARACGFEVAAAGAATRYRPAFATLTPSRVWPAAGVSADHAHAAGMSPRIYTALLDGTRSAVSMASVANATGLLPQARGLVFPPCGIHDLPRLLKPLDDGGILDGLGRVEMVSVLERDGRKVIGDLGRGAYVILRAQNPFAGMALAELEVPIDEPGGYAAMWRPCRMAGMEVGLSAAAAADGRATGCPSVFVADVVTVAKFDRAAGTILDGAGGRTVRGQLLPAAAAMAGGLLPIGLAEGVALTRAIGAGEPVSWSDVAIDGDDPCVRARHEMERMFAW